MLAMTHQNISLFGIMWTIAGDRFFVVYYYRKIIKYALEHHSYFFSSTSTTCNEDVFSIKLSHNTVRLSIF